MRGMMIGHDDAGNVSLYSKTTKCVSNNGELLMMDYKDYLQRIKI